jgi:hypothetical protein
MKKILSITIGLAIALSFIITPGVFAMESYSRSSNSSSAVAVGPNDVASDIHSSADKVVTPKQPVPVPTPSTGDGINNVSTHAKYTFNLKPNGIDVLTFLKYFPNAQYNGSNGLYTYNGYNFKPMSVQYVGMKDVQTFFTMIKAGTSVPNQQLVILSPKNIENLERQMPSSAVKFEVNENKVTVQNLKDHTTIEKYLLSDTMLEGSYTWQEGPVGSAYVFSGRSYNVNDLLNANLPTNRKIGDLLKIMTDDSRHKLVSAILQKHDIRVEAIDNVDDLAELVNSFDFGIKPQITIFYSINNDKIENKITVEPYGITITKTGNVIYLSPDNYKAYKNYQYHNDNYEVLPINIDNAVYVPQGLYVTDGAMFVSSSCGCQSVYIARNNTPFDDETNDNNNNAYYDYKLWADIYQQNDITSAIAGVLHNMRDIIYTLPNITDAINYDIQYANSQSAKLEKGIAVSISDILSYAERIKKTDFLYKDTPYYIEIKDKGTYRIVYIYNAFSFYADRVKKMLKQDTELLPKEKYYLTVKVMNDTTTREKIKKIQSNIVQLLEMDKELAQTMDDYSIQKQSVSKIENTGCAKFLELNYKDRSFPAIAPECVMEQITCTTSAEEALGAGK